MGETEDRVKRILEELDVKGEILASLADIAIDSMVTVFWSPATSLIAVYLDATVHAKPGEDKAYQYRGKWIRHLLCTFGVPTEDARYWGYERLKEHLNDGVQAALGQMRVITLGEVVEPVA